MAWWVILLIVWAVFVIVNYIAENAKEQRKKKELDGYIAGSNAWQFNKSLQTGNPQPLDKKNEEWALRIKKLLYDSAYYQNRNVYEFDNVLAELARVNRDILQEGGNPLVNQIIDRVEYLCGREKHAFTDIINSMRDSYLETPQKQNLSGHSRQSEYLEKDNLGTRQDTLQKADAYWYNRNFGTGKPEPYLLYAFETAEQAKTAISAIDFIHRAADTGNLISLKICHFGYYPTQLQRWEAFVGGGELTLNEFNKIKSLFLAHRGVVINEKAPDDGGNSNAETLTGSADLSQVIFKEKYNKPVPEGMGPGQYTYEVYEAPDKKTALAFLKSKEVSQPLYYLLVDTPQGSFGKDNGGIYDA